MAKTNSTQGASACKAIWNVQKDISRLVISRHAFMKNEAGLGWYTYMCFFFLKNTYIRSFTLSFTGVHVYTFACNRSCPLSTKNQSGIRGIGKKGQEVLQGTKSTKVSCPLHFSNWDSHGLGGSFGLLWKIMSVFQLRKNFTIKNNLYCE